jgi:3-hydroxybutyryl-CoA dehydrogenase
MRYYRQAAVIGAGAMGHGVAQVFAQGGLDVALYDSRPEAAKAAMLRIRGNLDSMVRHELLTSGEADGAYQRIRPATSVRDAAQDADFITECIAEDLLKKQVLFEELEACAPAEAIFACNTSTLLLADIGVRLRRKQRLIITHYFNPAHLVPVVEIVPGSLTDPEIVTATKALLSRLGKQPVVLKKEVAGFVVNRIQAAMAREVLFLLGEGVASAHEIDEAVRGTLGFRLAVSGPIQTMDFGGLDIWLEVVRNLVPSPEGPARAVNLLSDKVNRGELGVKVGRGFYNWEADKIEPASIDRASQREEAFLRLLRLLRGSESL